MLAPDGFVTAPHRERRPMDSAPSPRIMSNAGSPATDARSSETTDAVGARTLRRTVIRPPSGWPFPDFAELWRYRDLLSLLTL
ncbi:MAG: hypothetical protein AAF907_06470, partial [Planctomycetota bacterium]